MAKGARLRSPLRFLDDEPLYDPDLEVRDDPALGLRIKVLEKGPLELRTGPAYVGASWVFGRRADAKHDSSK